MPSLKLIAPLLLALETCSPRPVSPTGDDSSPPSPPAAPPPGPAAPPAGRPPEPACETAACWSARATDLEQRGVLDLAAEHRGRAFAAAPSAAAFDAWLDALLAARDLRRAHAALAAARGPAARDAGLRAALDARAVALPPPPPDAPLAPARLSAPLRAAREAHSAGRLRDAIAGYAAALAAEPEPVHLAAAADLLAPADPAGAARLRSLARARLRDAGARLSLLPVESWHTQHATWLGDQLVLARFVDGIDDYSLRLGALELWNLPPGPEGPLRRAFLPAPVDALAAADDGRTLVRASGGELVVEDVPTGEIAARFALRGEGRINLLAAVGSGASLRILAVRGVETTLLGSDGTSLQTFALAGTTPTITRAYTGEGSYHHNILQDERSWPVSLALTPDAGLVAIGGSDSKVRLFDRARGKTHTLSFPWQYTEHRHMGGNPDLNLPLALRFTPQGDALLATHRHGERILWDARSGRPRDRNDGLCSASEADAFVNRYVAPGEPRVTATDDNRRACAGALLATISPDARTIAVGGMGAARIRGADDRPIVTLIGHDLPGEHYAFSRSGALAMVSLYGRVDTWRPGETAASTALPPRPSGPIDPHISRDGRFLRWDLRPGQPVWDLFEQRRLEPTVSAQETLLALSDDGRVAAVHTGKALEIRDASSRAPLRSVPFAAGPFAAAVEFTGRGVLLVDDGPAGRSLLRLPTLDAPVETVKSSFQGQLITSPDGRWAATLDVSGGGASGVLDLATGALRWPLGGELRQFAFSRDGAACAWLALDAPQQPQVRASYRRTAEDAPARELSLHGWPAAVALTDDGAHVFILLESGVLHRWTPATGAHTQHDALHIAGTRRIGVVPGGEVLLLTAYDRIILVAADAKFTHLATLIPLLTGGWMARSAAGAFEGSDDAPRHLVTRAEGPRDALLLDGALGWDGALVPGLYRRALAGELVPAPIP